MSNKRIYWGLIFTLFISLIPNANKAQTRMETANSEGSLIYWRFDDIEAFNHNDKTYFKILIDNKKLLWNPVRKEFTNYDDIDKTDLDKIDFSYRGGGKPLNLDRNTVLIEREIPIETSFRDYYEIFFDGKIIGSFYLIVKRNISNLRFCCDDDRVPIDALAQKYDTNIGLWIKKVSNSLIILAFGVFDSPKSASMYTLGFRTMPKAPVTFGGNAFLIPHDLIAPELEQAGLDLKARYAVVEHFMSTAKLIPESSLGNYVKASRFFLNP